jgi:hypothetical protein
MLTVAIIGIVFIVIDTIFLLGVVAMLDQIHDTLKDMRK